MTGWSDFRCAIETAATQAVCDDHVVVQWSEDSRCVSENFILLSVISATPTYNREEVTGDPLTEVFTTMMTIVVQFRAEATHAPFSLEISEKTRINLRRLFVREPLREAGVVFVGMPGVTTPLTYSRDRKTVHTHIFEATFNVVFDTDTTTVGNISSVAIEGELETSDSVIVPVDFTVTQP